MTTRGDTSTARWYRQKINETDIFELDILFKAAHDESEIDYTDSVRGNITRYILMFQDGSRLVYEAIYGWTPDYSVIRVEDAYQQGLNQISFNSDLFYDGNADSWSMGSWSVGGNVGSNWVQTISDNTSGSAYPEASTELEESLTEDI